MTLREEIIDLSEDRLDESVVGGIIALAGLLGFIGTASAVAIADKIKTKRWEKAKRTESLEKKAWSGSGGVITSFNVTDNNLETFIIPSEDFLMKFASEKVVIFSQIKRVVVFDDFEFEQFLKELKKVLVERYKELFEHLHLYDSEKGPKVKKFLEKKLSVEFYCRGIVAFTKEQKEKVENTVKEAIKEAGLDKFRFKLLSATYK